MPATKCFWIRPRPQKRKTKNPFVREDSFEMSIDEEEKRIREAIDRSLNEWGVDRGSRASFCDMLMKRALLYHGRAKNSPLDFSDIRDRHLPTDPKEAIYHVLKESYFDRQDI